MDEFQNKKEYENEIYQLWLDKNVLNLNTILIKTFLFVYLPQM